MIQGYIEMDKVSCRIIYPGLLLFSLLSFTASAQAPGETGNTGSNSAIATHALAISGNLFDENTPEYSAMLRASIGALNAKQKSDAKPQNILNKIKTLTVTNLDTDSRYRNALSLIVHQAALGDPEKILSGTSDGPDTPRGTEGSGLPPRIPGGPPASNTPGRSYNATTHYPNVVFIQDAQNGFCSGVAIGKKKILTARHCVCLHNMKKVGVGVALGRDMSFTNIVSVNKMSECGDSNGPDIAVVETAQDIYDSNSPTIFSTTAELDKAKAGIAVGYGNRDLGNGGAAMDGQRGYASVAIISTSCSAQDSRKYGCNSGFEFVAGPVSAALPGDQCPGDSGGPLYIMSGNGIFLAGIADRPDTDSNLQCGYGGIYERIDGNVGNWIKKILASN